MAPDEELERLEELHVQNMKGELVEDLTPEELEDLRDTSGEPEDLEAIVAENALKTSITIRNLRATQSQPTVDEFIQQKTDEFENSQRSGVSTEVDESEIYTEEEIEALEVDFTEEEPKSEPEPVRHGIKIGGRLYAT